MATILPVGLALYGLAAVAIPCTFLVDPGSLKFRISIVPAGAPGAPGAIRKRVNLDALRMCVNAVCRRRQMYRGLRRARFTVRLVTVVRLDDPQKTLSILRVGAPRPFGRRGAPFTTQRTRA